VLGDMRVLALFGLGLAAAVFVGATVVLSVEVETVPLPAV
jgi:hypothetical protein